MRMTKKWNMQLWYHTLKPDITPSHLCTFCITVKFFLRFILIPSTHLFPELTSFQNKFSSQYSEFSSFSNRNSVIHTVIYEARRNIIGVERNCSCKRCDCYTTALFCVLDTESIARALDECWPLADGNARLIWPTWYMEGSTVTLILPCR